MTSLQTGKLLTYPLIDCEEYIMQYIQRTCVAANNNASENNNDSVVGPSPHDIESLIRDLPGILDRCFKIANNITSLSSSDDPQQASATLHAFFHLFNCLLPMSEGAIANKFCENDSAGFKRLSRILVSLIQNNCNSSAPEASPRLKLLEFIHTLADTPECKSPIANYFFEPLFQFLGRAPEDLLAYGDDDFNARRTAAHVITSAVRSSATAKNYILSHQKHHLLKILAGIVSDTPTGDFFFQLQCLEIIYRVTRVQQSVIDSLHLPSEIREPLKGNKISGDDQFVVHLMNLLDLYNSRRQREEKQRLQNQNNNNNNNNDDASQQQSQSHHHPSLTKNSFPSVLFEFRVSGFSIDCTNFNFGDDQQQPQQQQKEETPFKLYETNEDLETAIWFSNRVAVLLLPKGNGHNITLNYHQLHTVKISRDFSVHFTFKNPSRKLVESLLPEQLNNNNNCEEERYCYFDNNSRSEVSEKISSSQNCALSIHVRFDTANGAAFRSSCVQSWISDALKRKKSKTRYNNNNNNITSSASSENQQKQEQQQQPPQNHHVDAAAAVAATDAQANNNNNENQNQQEQQQENKNNNNNSKQSSRAVSNSSQQQKQEHQHQEQNQQQVGALGESKVNADSSAKNSRCSSQKSNDSCVSSGNQQQSSRTTSATGLPPLSSGLQNNNNDENQNNNNQDAAKKQEQQQSETLFTRPSVIANEIPVPVDNTNTNINADNANSNTGMDAIMSSLKNLVGGRLHQRRNEAHNLIQETAQAISRLVEAGREESRRERDELDFFIKSEMAALKEADEQMKYSGRHEVEQLNSELDQLSKRNASNQSDVQRLLSLVEDTGNSAREAKQDWMKDMKGEVEQSLQGLEQLIRNLSVENALPVGFLQNIVSSSSSSATANNEININNPGPAVPAAPEYSPRGTTKKRGKK